MNKVGIRRLRERLPAGDAGTSLMELVIGMAVMAIFMSIFTGAVVSMGQTINKVEAVTISSTQVNQAFLRLDKLVRYAAAITNASPMSTSTSTTPTISGDWYVELDTTTATSEICTQLRVDSKQLQQRTWTVTGSTFSTPSNFSAMASGITNGGVAAGPDQPFGPPPAAAGASTNFQRLSITLVATSGSTSSSTTRSSVSFTALNSLAASATNNAKCQQAGRP
jgi:hypothetical protein